VVLVDTTDVKELVTTASLLVPLLLGDEVISGLLFMPGLVELEDMGKSFSGGVFEGNCTVTVAVRCWLTATELVTEAVVFEACVTTIPAEVATAGLVEEADELTEILLAVMVGFDKCNDVVVKGELLAAVVTMLLVNTVFPSPVPGLKSLELLTIVAKLGKGLCSTAMLVGTL